MDILCPLSKSHAVELIDLINVRDVLGLYSRHFNMDLSAEFGELRNIGLYHCHESDMNFFHPCISGSESFYENLQRFDWYYMDEKNEYGFASRFIDKTAKVLEIGCGKGVFSKKISCSEYRGLEFSREAMRMAEQDGIVVLNEPVRSHANRNREAYDVVCSFQVLEHVTDVHAFIEASLDCLKPGGLLIYSVPSLDSFSRQVGNFVLDLPPHHVTRWTDLSLRNIAKYFPLEVIELWHEPLQDVHRAFYAGTIFRTALLDMFNIPFLNVDMRFTTRLITHFSNALGRLFARGLTRPEVMPRGISVTCVYRKRGGA